MDNKELEKYNDEQAREVGLPSPAALQYMMSVADMLTTTVLISADMEPHPTALAALKQAGWKQDEIDIYRDKVIKHNALAKMLIGHEMGISPMASLQDVDIVKGRIFVRYPQLISQMMAKGFTCEWIERSNERAALKVTRPGLTPDTFEFTIDDARRAGLTPTSKPEYDQYKLRPRVMLTARVASEAYRTMGGRSIYTPEEKAEVMGTTDSTESDQLRADQLKAQEEKYHVGLKPNGAAAPDITAKAETEPAEKPTETKPPKEPKPVDPEKQAPADGYSTIVYEVYMIQTTGSGDKKPVLCIDIPPQKNKATASMMATAEAMKTGVDHEVVEFNPTTGERVTKDHAKAPPSKRTTAATPAIPTTSAKDEANKRMEALVPFVGAPEKTAKSRFGAFMAGYIGCAASEFKNAALDAKMDSLSELEAMISAGKDKSTGDEITEFNAGPEAAGKKRRQWRTETLAYLQGKWPKSPDHVALASALARKWQVTPAQFAKWFEMDSIALDFLEPEDIAPTLRVLLKTREGVKLLKHCKAHNLSVKKVVEQMETRLLTGKDGSPTPIEAAEPKAIESAIETVARKIKEEISQPTAPVIAAPEPPAAVAEEPAAEDGLFDSFA
jgi:hypothetical protein